MKSKFRTAMNCIAEHIENVTVEQLVPDNQFEGEIIIVTFKDGKKKYINTKTNYCGTSYRQCKKSKTTNLDIQSNRFTTVINNIPTYINGTRIQLGTLVGLAKDKYMGIERDSYVGLDVNHMDRTGNINIYGYSNNMLWNMEITSKENNDKHWRCIERVQKILNRHIAFSANEEDILNSLEFLNDSELADYIDNNSKIVEIQ